MRCDFECEDTSVGIDVLLGLCLEPWGWHRVEVSL